MAKPSKVEDYWRQHNIENLFRELTQILVRRMPSDPALAIVEILQKKFPRSFKTSADNVGIVSKTLANNLQLQSTTSPHFDGQNGTENDLQMGRRLSNQSLATGAETFPITGSNFNDLLKHDTSITSQAPELTIRNLASINRISQQAVKMGKDIRSDHDILEEELIKPTKMKSHTSTTADVPFDSGLENIQHDQTHEQPSVKQIIKYKQHIHTENDRRAHREELANLAKQQREKEQILLSDLTTKPEEIGSERQVDGGESSTQVVPTGTSTNQISNKPIVKSKEEEEILNDENVFQPRKLRPRGRQRNRVTLSRSNTPRHRGQSLINGQTVPRKIVCKVCGNEVNGEDNQISAVPIARPFEPHPSARSEASSSGAVDDWFETESNENNSRHMSPWAPDDPISSLTGSTTFRRSLFQPIKDDPTEHRAPILPLSAAAVDETKSKRLNSPRISESGIFARSPDVKIRRPSSARSIPSPVTKKHQPDTTTKTSHQSPRTIAQPSPSKTQERRMSGPSAREPSPDLWGET